MLRSVRWSRLKNSLGSYIFNDRVIMPTEIWSRACVKLSYPVESQICCSPDGGPKLY